MSTALQLAVAWADAELCWDQATYLGTAHCVVEQGVANIEGKVRKVHAIRPRGTRLWSNTCASTRCDPAARFSAKTRRKYGEDSESSHVRMSALEVPRQSRAPLSRRVVCWGHVDWIIIDEDNDIRVDRAATRRHEAQEAAGGNMTRSFTNRRRSNHGRLRSLSR